ncbi:PRC-barrel domain-containing protein [Pseudonocardia sp. H11422]|uniref:PRC-barrel domain-containing protein n=1 Tax=Pseudonocardia sp. H11422 TaxID=2835866 RepID=UPI001BDD1185|nr:PRC-barrel domain-containing protein [Pseudonocardia sp. H11422]
MTQPLDWAAYQGRPLYDQDDAVIGVIEEFYVDRDGGEAVWVLVIPGVPGTAQSFVPLRDARARGEDLQVSVSGNEVQNAPSSQPGGELSGEEERQLYQHYDMSYPGQETPAGGAAAESIAAESGREPSGTGDQPQQHRPSLLRRLLGLDRDTRREEATPPRQKVEKTV